MTATDAAPHADHLHDLPSLAGAALPERAREVLEHQLQGASNDLGRQLQIVLRESAQALTRQSEREQDPGEQAALLDSARRLHEDAPAFVARFLRELEAVLAELQAPRMVRTLEEITAPVHGLSLVDAAEMEEGTALVSIAARGDARNSLALQLLGYRYGVLAGAPAFDAEHLPVGPHALCHVLRNACHALLPHMAARQLVYRQFEKIVIPHYPALLDALNGRMVRDGILPHLSFVPVRARAANAATDAPGAAGPASAAGEGLAGAVLEDTFRTDEDDEPEFQEGAGDPSAPAHGAIGAQGVDTAHGGAEPPTDTSQWTIDRPGSEPGWIWVRKPAAVDAEGDAAAGVAQHDGPPALPATFAALQDLLAQRRALLAKLRADGADDRVRETLERDEVLGMLRRLRRNQGRHGSLADIRQTVMAQARQLHGHGVALGQDDADVFELLGMFASQLQREMRAGSPGEALVERLRLPLLQLALREPDFFVDPAHPARMLVDAASMAGARWLAEDDLDAQWLGLLQRAVGTAQEDPDGSHDGFLAANHALQDGLQAAARKAEMAERRQVDAARGREKLDLARQRATREIDALVNGRPLPRFHAILLEQAWTDVLALALLRGGEDAVGWRELRATTAQIVEASMGAVDPARDPGFAMHLQEALGQVGYHADDAAAIARQLASGQAEDAGLASRTELIVQLKSRTRLGEDNMATTPGATQAPLTPAERAAHAVLASQAEARWVDVAEGAGGTLVRRRLSWVSPRSGHALLTNRRGQRVEGGHLDALARLMASDRLRIVDEDAPPARVAWQATVAALERVAHGRDNEGGAQ